MLNYDEMLILDAKSLAEGGMLSAYEDEIIPALQRLGVNPVPIEEELDPDKPSYTVIAPGKTYVIYSRDVKSSEENSWGNATFALFDIVNRQLEGTPYRFYAINGGNDLGGMFLTEAMREEAIESLERKADWPYLPEDSHPWYGQPHD
jgi:hypothetical protein